MKTLGWPPNFVAQCPVRLFEAAGGSNSWQPSGTVGELHMRPMGNAMLHFQLHDLLDNQVLFEHTMRKPDAFMVSAQRFFVIRLENGSFRGFGFTDDGAACEMKERVQKAVKPFIIRESIETPAPKESLVVDEPRTSTIPAQPPASVSAIKRTPDIVSYESVPRRTASRRSTPPSKEQPSSPVQSLEVAAFGPTQKVSKIRSRWKFVLKGLATLTQMKGLHAISHFFGWSDHEIEIGYPTDVKHVAHIGWDGPSVSGSSWMDELKPAPDFSAGPLREFGQPKGPDWIHDALSAAKWTANGLAEDCELPPAPPREFQDPDSAQAGKRSGKRKYFTSRHKSKASMANHMPAYHT